MDNNERLASLKNDKSFIRRIYWHLMYEIAVCFTMERMMGCSMTLMMIDASKDLYPDDPAKQQELAQHHMVFFNTQQTFGAVVWGIALGMEIERARTGEVPDEMIQSIKTALAGPLAGLGDTVWQTLFVPILLSISIGLSEGGSIIGPIFAVVVYVAVNWACSYYLFAAGVKMGVDGADMLLSGSLKERVLPAIEVMGIIVVGAVVANNCSLGTALVLNVNGVTVDLQADVLDAIYGGLIPLIGSVIVYWLIKAKHLSANKIMLGMLVVAIIGYFTTILA